MKNKRLDDLPDILTAQHIADYLTISRRRVYELFQLSPEHGGIPNFEIGASKRVVKEDFIRWIERMKSSKWGDRLTKDAEFTDLKIEGSRYKDSTNKEMKRVNKQRQVLDCLADWVIRTVNKKELATPEEIGALPKVAEVVIKYYSLVSFSPVKNE